MIFISTAAYGNLGRPQIAPRINWLKSTVGLWPFLAIGATFGVYGVGAGVLLNAALFAAISHVLTLRLLDRSAQPARSPGEEEAAGLQAPQA